MIVMDHSVYWEVMFECSHQFNGYASNITLAKRYVLNTIRRHQGQSSFFVDHDLPL
jgi:hypothetical protein